MKEIAKLIAALGVVCAVGCALLVWVDRKTKAPREEVVRRQLEEKLLLAKPEAILGTFDASRKAEFEGVVFHRAYAGGGVSYVVAESSARGFGGEMRVLVGIDVVKNELARVIVSEHHETAGLGTRATDRSVRKSLWRTEETAEQGGLPPNEFLDGQFANKPLARVELNKNADGKRRVDGVSGATYSSRGVTAAVDDAIRVFLAHRSELLN